MKTKFKNLSTILAKVTFALFISVSFLFVQCNGGGDNQNSDSDSTAVDDSIVKVVRQAGEFEKQARVWLIWSPLDHVTDMTNEDVTLRIIDALAPHVKIIVTVQNDSLLQRAKDAIPAELVSSGQVELKLMPSEELWVRDMGPNFVELSNGEKAIADFNFDAWGYTPHDNMDDYTITMEKYDEAVGEMMGLKVISTDMYSEGGNRELNGKGTIMMNEVVEMGRNTNLSKEQIENEFRRVLGVTNFVWLTKGVVEDDHTFLGPIDVEGGKAYTVITTNGHIDEFARFVNANTILLADVPEEDLDDPVAAENKKRMDINYEILKKAVDQDGKPFNIVRIPTPHTILRSMEPGDPVYDYISTLEYQDGSEFPVGEKITTIAASSYLNFLISNNVIVAQKYWKEGMDEAVKARDEEVKKILQEVFPKREIIMINAMPVNWGGGGVHCISMQEPA